MNIRQAERKDLKSIVEMIADDVLGQKRENFQIPLPKEYIDAFENVQSDQNQELMVMEGNNSEIIGTLQL